MQLWALGVASPRGTADFAAKAEQAGWDGLLVVDSQNLSGDAYVALAMAATSTSSLGLGTGVTNNATRHPAVTASAIASVAVPSASPAPTIATMPRWRSTDTSPKAERSASR